MKESDKAAYGRYVAHRAARSPVLRNCASAFLVGGGICVLGELLFALYRALGASLDTAGVLMSVSLVFLSVLLTALGVYDRIARFAGAGTLVPITGFANAVASPAIDTKSEGMILGVGAKIFTVAGPVLLFGILSGALYGVVYYVTTLFV